MANNNNQGLYNSMNPLSYMGVNPTSPSQMMLVPRAPTDNDTNFLLGTMWLNTSVDNPTLANVYILLAKPNNVARWLPFGE